jgi:hypothetical protein
MQLELYLATVIAKPSSITFALECSVFALSVIATVIWTSQNGTIFSNMSE